MISFLVIKLLSWKSLRRIQMRDSNELVPISQMCRAPQSRIDNTLPPLFTPNCPTREVCLETAFLGSDGTIDLLPAVNIGPDASNPTSKRFKKRSCESSHSGDTQPINS